MTELDPRDAEIARLRGALEAISRLGGNLSDEALENVAGPNEGRSRGIMYVGARQIALQALEPKS